MNIARVALLTLSIFTVACDPAIEPFSPSRVDREVGTSEFPTAIDPSRVGTYPGHTKSGAGYFYDDVLEYRVWMHPEKGAKRVAGDEDYFAAFAQYERALTFSKHEPGAEPPLVLVRQREHVNEPAPGQFEWVKVERITEWQPKWLPSSRRTATSIPEFLASHRTRK